MMNPWDALAGMYQGMPQYPTYMGMDQSQLRLLPMAQRVYGGINLNTQPMDEYTKEAMRTGPSAAANLAMNKQDIESSHALDTSNAAAAGAAASAKNDLAMHGGLRSGAAEEIGTRMGNRAAETAQGTRNQAMTNKANIALTDEGNRVQMLGNAPGMQTQAAEFGLQKGQGLLGTAEGDVNRVQLENSKENAFNLGRYNSAMQAWGASKQADATANSGKK